MASRLPPSVANTAVSSQEGDRARMDRLLMDIQRQQGTSRDQGVPTNHQKRERSQNWDQMEKCLLVQLVQKRIAIVENKAGDTGSIRRRKHAWREIYNEFSAKVGGVPRELQRMREQWRRIKHWAKHEMRYFMETEELDVNRGVRKPNELAKYICEIMRDFDPPSSSSFTGNFQNNDELQEEMTSFHDRDKGEHPQFTAFPVLNNGTDSSQLSNDVAITSDDVIPVSLETIQVKEEPESVDLVNDDDDNETPSSSAAVTMATPSTMISTSASWSSHQRRANKGRANVRKSILPSWTKDFPDIIGEETAQRTSLDEEEDDDSDLLDDSDDDDLGSLSDWGTDNSVHSRPYDGSTSAIPRRQEARESDVKFERQRLAFARREFKRRMQMMEAEHASKMQILEVRRETAQLKKKMVFRQLKQHRPPQTNSSNSFNRYGNHHR